MCINIYIRDIEMKDLDDYYSLNSPGREHHKFNGPYFGIITEDELKAEVQDIKTKLENGESNPLGQRKIIADADTDAVIGTVNWYWKSVETLWLEVGVVVFNEDYWGKGIATKALTAWISQVFSERPEIVRIGLSTWSGNFGMCRVARKLRLKEEARYRNARIVDGKYYDSVSYGVLREEWENKE